MPATFRKLPRQINSTFIFIDMIVTALLWFTKWPDYPVHWVTRLPV